MSVALPGGVADAVAISEAAGVAAWLAADGLPEAWGVLVVDGPPRRVLRPARGLREPEPWEVVGWAGRICASYTQRGLLRASPMAGELA